MESASSVSDSTDCELFHKHGTKTCRRAGVRLLPAVVTACAALACGDGETAPLDPPRPSDITVAPDSVTMRAVGDTARFVAEVRDQRAAILADYPVAWSSSDTSIVAVDATGLARAAGDGLATILATAGTATDRAVVLVRTPRGALADLYEATAGQQWLDNTGWLTDEPLASWYGVTPHEDGSRLARLELRANRLRGVIPPSMRELFGLEVLDLSENDLVGSIDESLADLVDLQVLYLQDNLLTGVVPAWIGTLTSLRVLSVGNNQLSGPIPASVGELDSLTVLELHGNRLEGALPPSLQDLTSLDSLYLHDNSLTGSLPAWLGDLTNLVDMSLRDNQLDGEIPETLGNLTRLRNLSLQRNELEGELPAELGALAELVRLSLHENRLTGPIPPSLGDLAKLEELYLQENELTGEIPSSLGELASLRELSLRDNQLTGEIPASLGSLAGLRQLALQHNDLEGAVPASLGGLVELEELFLQGNSALSGSLPLGLAELSSLHTLDLRDTELCAPRDSVFQTWLEGVETRQGVWDCPSADIGPLTELYEATGGANWTTSEGWLDARRLGDWYGVQTLSGSGRVVRLRLAGNGLAGDIPSSLGELPELEALWLFENRLTGPIPESLGDLTKLEELYLQENELTGEIPSSLGNLASLRELSLRDNQLTGEIPSSVGNLTGLRQLALQHNDLAGALPASLGELSELEELFLQGNSALSGPLPPSLAGLSNLHTLDLRDTELCAPRDSVFQTWLEGIETRQGVWDCPSADIGPLTELYEATGGANWTTSEGWLDARRLGDWYGVQTLSGSGRVVRLQLGGNGLAGDIPSSLGELPELEALWLFENRLTGPIPESLGDLAKLKELYLQENELTGDIPSTLGNLAGLRELSMRDNQLTGEIPASLGKLAGLRQLALQRNDLEGAVPASLGSLVELEELFLQGNSGLSGPLPLGIAGLTNLHTLDLRDTELCAPRDSVFQTWLEGVETRLGVWDCPSADIGPLTELYEATGGANWTTSDGWLDARRLGDWFGVQTLSGSGRVVRLQLGGNGLSGKIPASLGKLTRLKQLALQWNQLEGEVPAALGELVELEELYLRGNSALSGPLPLSLTGLANLHTLDLRATKLCAPRNPAFQRWLDGVEMRQGVWDCPSRDIGPLVELYEATDGPGWTNNTGWLDARRLGDWYGVATLSGSGRVVALELGGNSLAGKIPTSLGSLTRLELLHLFDNGLSGPVPESLGGLTNLRELSLRDNQLTGALPASLGNLTALEQLWLRGNTGLSGALPLSLVNLTDLRTLDLRDTGLCAPRDSSFQAWLDGVDSQRGVFTCPTS